MLKTSKESKSQLAASSSHFLREIIGQKASPNYFSLWQTLKFFVWLYFCVPKSSHRRRLKTARKLLGLFQQEDFQKMPGKLFAYLRKIDPFVFEELLLLCFKARGFQVKHNQAYTGDGGFDGIVILPNKKRFAIQAKRYQWHIDRKDVEDFCQLIKIKQLHGGFFIHTGRTGEAAYEARQNLVYLISGNGLHGLITGFFQ